MTLLGLKVPMVWVKNWREKVGVFWGGYPTVYIRTLMKAPKMCSGNFIWNDLFFWGVSLTSIFFKVHFWNDGDGFLWCYQRFGWICVPFLVKIRSLSFCKRFFNAEVALGYRGVMNVSLFASFIPLGSIGSVGACQALADFCFPFISMKGTLQKNQKTFHDHS